MLPLVGVYDTVLQTDEFSLLVLPWRPPSCEDVACPAGMANAGNRNRCRITPVQLLRLNLSVLSSWGIPVVHAYTLGQISKQACRKEVKVVNELYSGHLFWYQH